MKNTAAVAATAVSSRLFDNLEKTRAYKGGVKHSETRNVQVTTFMSRFGIRILLRLVEFCSHLRLVC